MWYAIVIIIIILFYIIKHITKKPIFTIHFGTKTICPECYGKYIVSYGDDYLMTHPRFNKIILVHMGVAADKFDTEDQAKTYINKYKEQCQYEATIVNEIEIV